MVASDVPSYFCLHGLYQHVITEKASNVSIYEHEKIGKCIDGETDTVKTASLVTFTKEVRTEVCIKAFFYSTENMKLGESED